MTITPLNLLQSLPDGTELECIEIRLSKVDEGQKAFGQGTMQGSFAEDAQGNKSTVRWVDFDPLGQDWRGHWMRLTATRNGRGDLHGISVDSYNNKKRLNIKGNDKNGQPRVQVEWIDAPSAPAQRSGPPARDDVHYDQPRGPQPPPRPAQGPPPAQPAGPPPASKPSAPPPPNKPAPPHGATMGMAVKEAYVSLIQNYTDGEGKFHTPSQAVELKEFWWAVHKTASEILHVCRALESGDITPSITATPDYVAEEQAEQDGGWIED